MKKFTLLAILLVVGFSGIAQNTAQTSPPNPVLADTSAPTTLTNRTAKDVSSTVVGRVTQVQTATGVIFEDNFDNQVTWYPETKEEGCNFPNCIDSVPDGWNYYRSAELWHPNFDGSQFHPVMQISNENHRGLTGKGYTQWNESNNGRSGDGWGADGILAKDLGADYKELFVQLYVKFDTGFQWGWTESAGVAVKMFRVYHWDRTGSPFSFFKTGMSCPIYIMDFAHNAYGFRHFHSFRCDPQETNYYCEGGGYDKSYTFTNNPTFEEIFGDGDWHQLKWHVKMNSVPGTNDGVFEFWTDDILELSRSDIQWMGTNSPGDIGWNIVGIGGNANNHFAATEDQKEQWYAIDDIVVSTTPISTTDPLSLHAAPADRALHLSWMVNTTLPVTSTWRIDYASATGSTYLPVSGIVSATRVYTLTGLTNYVPYTVTLNAMLDGSPILTDTVTAMPTDILVYLPLILK